VSQIQQSPVMQQEPVPLVPRLAGCPYAAYAELRDQGGVHQAVMTERLPVWVVSRYADVRALLSDQRLSMNARTAGHGYRGLELPPALNEHLMNVDAADHARLRRLVSSAFTARRIDGLRDRVQEVADALIDEFAPTGSCDLLAQFAVRLPVIVISELLGIPQQDGAAFRELTRALMIPSGQGGPARPARPALVAQMHAFLLDLVERKRAEPGDDLLSAMIAAHEGDDRLSEDELTSLAFLILWAGYETTVYLIASGAALLIADSQAAALVRSQQSPHTPEMASVVEELMRFEGPVLTSIRRFPLQDIEVGGRTNPAGSTVLLALGSANRDPREFADPDRLDLGRDLSAHVGFGHGPHYCLGAPLARLEVCIALWTLLRRLPDLALAVAPNELPWKLDYRQHALTELPVTFTPTPAL
jgi:cytochrome P450